MIHKFSPRVSLVLTTCSLLLALINIQLGRRLNYLEHLLMFNTLAAGMLAFAAAALVVAGVALAKARGRGVSLWLPTVLAIVVLGSYLLED